MANVPPSNQGVTLITPPAPSGVPRWLMPILSVGALLLFAYALVMVLNKSDDKYIMLMLGAVISLVNQGPWSFIFGSSASSQKKDEVIASQKTGQNP